MQKEVFLSEPPIVRLIDHSVRPYDTAVAAARTCYSSRIITPEEVSKDEKTRILRDTIAKSVFEAGHHTVFQHATFHFTLDRISRQFIWSFLHSHPYYNSEQVSQRYVEVNRENFSIPPLDDHSKKIYLSIIDKQMMAYNDLINILIPDIEKEYFRIFCGRKKEKEKYGKEIKKKAQEIARYVLPVATFAHMYHTINGITLFRYYRLAEQLDVPLEQRLVVDAMIDEVRKIDPLFLEYAKDAIELEETLEHRILYQMDIKMGNRAFLKEFDDDLGYYNSKLYSYNEDAQEKLAKAIRSVLGVTRNRLTDEEAISIVLDPSKNSYLGETLNLSMMPKLMKPLEHVHYAFRKKLSHTADSQNQRHRTTPGSRPILTAHLTKYPDFITPALINNNKQALDLYNRTMNLTWVAFTELLNNNIKPEYAIYVLPNALTIRLDESGSLASYHYKWGKRLCYNAQEEIFKISKEEVEQIREVHPLIGKFLGAPCASRLMAKTKPFCPEGKRFCGVNVWNLNVEEYERII